MKRILLSVSCLLAIQLIFSAGYVVRGQNNASTTTVQELTKLDTLLDDAYIRGDKKVFEQTLADEMISVSAEGDVAKKPDILSQIGPPSTNVKISIVAAEVNVYTFGDTAIVTSLKTLKTERSDRSTSDHYRETNTYVRKDSSWQLISSQQSHEPPPYSAKDVQLNLNIDPALMGGNKKATVVLIEFLDYECPHCRGFAASTMKQLEHDYITSGRIGYVVRELPLEEIHPYAFKAAEAAQCAATQGKFWAMNQRLFQEPMALTESDLLTHAEILQLDMAKFRQCISDQKTATAVRQGLLEAAGMGVRGTPIFLVGVKKPNSNSVKALRMIQGGYPYAVFKATLDTIISAQTP